MHIGIRDFGHRSQIKEDDQQSDETSHTEIHPLDVLETLLGIHSLGGEDARGEERCNKGTNTLDTLSEIETDFRATGRPADGKEVAGAGLERGQASSNDEHAATKTSEGCFYSTWPEEKAANGNSEAITSQNPSRDGQGA